MWKEVASAVWIALLLRKAPAIVRWWRGPSLTREAVSLLDDVRPPTPEEIALYVPENFRNPGPDWIFTRGKVLAFNETVKTRRVGSAAGFDVAKEFDEDYSVYRGVYGYRDHRNRLYSFFMKPTENDQAVRPGRTFIICFNRNSPGRHHLFTPVRTSHPTKRG